VTLPRSNAKTVSGARTNAVGLVGWCYRAEKIIARYLLLQLPARRSDFEIRFSEVCRRMGRTKTQSNGVPENLRCKTAFHDRRD
jgi:hypothetical protein